MLDIAFIRQNADIVRTAVKNKRLDLDVDALLVADKARRETVALLDEKRAKKNTLSSLIPKAAAEERPKWVAEAKEVRAEIERLEPRSPSVRGKTTTSRYERSGRRAPSTSSRRTTSSS
jgi:seryl-tRNA synthetase